MTADQGGRSGVMVKFFGREASMSSGAVRLALKYGAALIPAFYARVKGPSIKMIIGEPFELKKTADSELDIQENLQRLIPIFEGYIREYPQEYLWTYKIWKYGRQKNILILDDGKTGHLRQSQAAAAIAAAHFKEKGIDVKIETLEIKFKSGISRSALNFSSCLAGKYHCQGCLWCLRSFLKEDAYRAILAQKPDVVVSCGSSVAPVNFVVSRENMAKSVVIMRPSFLSTNRFDLVVMPRHDHPPRRKNIVVTEGALNLIDDEYLQEKSKELIGVTSHKRPEGALSPQGEGSRVASKYLGLLLGGDSKSFRLDTEIVREVIRQLKKAAQDLNAEILVTTSRRTPAEVEALVKRELKDYSRCKLLVIANEKNIPSAVGGILGLSRIVVVTPESISMVSESASSGKHTLVFKAGVSPKHRHFLKQLSRDNYIHYVAASGIAARIEEILQGRFQAKVLSDSNKVKLGLSRII
jgi:mitochondrial fission protein ELM1